MSNVFDKLAVSRPVNKAAACVVSGGAGFMPRKPIPDHMFHSHAPLPIRAEGHETAQGLAGTAIGRLKVLGVFDEAGRKKKARWVVRCSCGDYETRSARAIRNPANADDMCVNCRRTVYMREKYGKFRAAS